MNTTIWKYRLENVTSQTLKLPCGANILTVQEQGFSICLWVAVNPDEKRMVDRIFHIVGTGQKAQSLGDMNYITTLQQENGAFVWHVFETINVAR